MRISGWKWVIATFILLAFLVGCAGAPPQSAPAKTEEKTPVAEAPKEAPKEQPKAERPKEFSEEETLKVPTPNKKYTLGVLVPHLKNPHFVAQAYGYIEEAKALGCEVILLEAGGYEFLDKQISQLEDLVQRGVDGISIVAVDLLGTAAAVDDVVKKGIKVVNANVMTASDSVSARIRNDDAVAGILQADFMNEKLGGKGKIVMINGQPGSTSHRNSAAGFRDTVATKYKGLEIIAERWCQSDKSVGMSITEDVLQTFPDITALYLGDDMLAMGAGLVVETAGKKDQILITSRGFNQVTSTYLEDGKIDFLADQQSALIGRVAIRMLVRALNGELLPENVWAPLRAVTKENMNKIDRSTSFAPDGWVVPR